MRNFKLKICKYTMIFLGLVVLIGVGTKLLEDNNVEYNVAYITQSFIKGNGQTELGN